MKINQRTFLTILNLNLTMMNLFLLELIEKGENLHKQFKPFKELFLDSNQLSKQINLH